MDHGRSETEKDYGRDLLERAKVLSEVVARDQYEKLREEFRKRDWEWF